MMKCLIMAMLAVAVVGLSGCKRASNEDVQQQVKGFRQEMNTAADNAKRAADDAALANRVKQAIKDRKGMDARALDVDAKAGVVTLKGDVGNRDQADLAERVATEVKGVSSVNNQLAVRIPAKDLPPSGTRPGDASPPSTDSNAPAPSAGR